MWLLISMLNVNTVFQIVLWINMNIALRCHLSLSDWRRSGAVNLWFAWMTRRSPPYLLVLLKRCLTDSGARFHMFRAGCRIYITSDAANALLDMICSVTVEQVFIFWGKRIPLRRWCVYGTEWKCILTAFIPELGHPIHGFGKKCYNF